jgi:hypothetical protein
VWIRFKEGVSAQRAAGHMKNLRALAETVPAIQSIRAGANFTDRARGFTHGLVVTLASRQDLPRYLEHPDHVKAAGPLKEDAAEVLAMDIED